MSSVVEIVNSALISLGASTINSLTEDSTEANAANAKWDVTRRSILRSHPWNFAIKRVQLGQQTGSPVFRYTYRYSLPSDNLRLLKVYLDTDYKVEARTVLTDANNCKVKYISDITDTTQWDAAFVDAMAARITHELAYTITGHRSQSEYWAAISAEKLAIARMIDASEDIADDLGQEESSFISVRY